MESHTEGTISNFRLQVKKQKKTKKTCALGLYKERFVIEASFDHVPMNYFILYQFEMTPQRNTLFI